MRVKLLGTAAGGGFPQWNCCCPNCSALRYGNFHGKARTQLQVAISGDGESWCLLNASPDLRAQLEADRDFWPHGAPRSTPISTVVLTGAEVDQVLGLLTLREFQRFAVYATTGVQSVLREDNSIFGVLNRLEQQVKWIDIVPEQAFQLLSRNGEFGLSCTMISVGDCLPAYVSDSRAKAIPIRERSLGLVMESKSRRRLGFFPAVPALNSAMQQQLSIMDVILFDGTFWSEDELTTVQAGGPTGREMGHIPVSGPSGSLQLLSGLRARKIYVHMNNTNPMLDESGPEYRQVREAGWELGEDGWQFEL